jgi:hypothetical protein
MDSEIRIWREGPEPYRFAWAVVIDSWQWDGSAPGEAVTYQKASLRAFRAYIALVNFLQSHLTN